MRWFLRSAVAAVSLGSVAPVALAQPETPPPMMPPVRPLPEEEEPPASGFTRGLPVPATPAPVATPMPLPVAPRMPQVAPVAPVAPPPATQAAAWEPAVSQPKPPPPVIIQNARPGNFDDPPASRPDRLPPFDPMAPKAPVKPRDPALPAPPVTAKLPAIPLAPLAPTGPAPTRPKAPIAPAPGKPTATPSKPGTPGRLPALWPAQPGSTATAPPAKLPNLPPVTPPAAMVGSSAVCSAANSCCGCPTSRVSELVCDPLWRLCPQDGPVRVRGWLDGGYVYNSVNPNSKFNGPYNSVDRSAEPMFNQAYMILDRPLPTNGSFGGGFRVDTLFGYDFFRGQSRGFEVDRDFNQRWNGQYYGLAIPQAYTEFGNNIASMKVGHFYSLVGYESLASVNNFFYSHAYSYQFGQPITHWGGVLTTQLTRHWQVQAGLVNGWDSLVGRANNVNFTGSLKYTPDSNWWWTSFALVSGQEQNNLAQLPGVIGTDGNRTRYSFLFGMMPGGPGGRWEYVFHHFYGWQENGTPQGNFARWYGIDQYLYYRVSKSVRLGTRFEWFRDEDGTQVGLLNRPSNPNNPPLPGNYYSLTAGMNYTPAANFMLRPEIRWDFTSDTTRRAFDDGKKNQQLLLGCDLIWQF